MTAETAPAILAPSAVVVGASAADQAAAIERVGAILVEQGIVTPRYIEGMKAREAVVSTYLGNGVALPHGTNDYTDAILRTGLAVAQFPDGVAWGDEPARIVIGLAAIGEEHIEILSRLATILVDEATCARLAGTTDAAEIHAILTAPPDEAVEGEAAGAPVQGDVVRTVRIANPAGLHARPAAIVTERLLDFDSDVTLVVGDRTARGLSVTEVIALGATRGTEITVAATGDDAEAAVEAVLEVLLSETELS